MDSYDRAAQLFKVAMALPPDRRDEYIDRECSDDKALGTRVRRMMAYVDQSSSTQDLLADSPMTNGLDNRASLVGALVGPYHIEGVIGEGGFGVVYQARQEHPLRRTVALKILKATTVSGAAIDLQPVVARFEAERQVLAMMEHPGIARVIDAGQTETALGSRPYVVMELVEGEPITEFCEKHRLNWKARLKLFVTVCHAVQHAHQRGIIHRDLKPSNILVTIVDGVPSPKVIDFGIAKAVSGGTNLRATTTLKSASAHPESDSPTSFTGPLLGTPQYMSPEQARGDERAIDIRTDVYSLGVVLYELVTGSTPLDAQTLRKLPHDQMLQMILNQEVEKPSTRLRRTSHCGSRAATLDPANNGSKRGQLNGARPTSSHLVPVSRVRGELDWITRKSLHVDRNRRYSNVAALADEIERYLKHKPVEAGPRSSVYSARKFVRRHWLIVSTCGVSAIAILVGAGVAISKSIDARRAADEANQLNQVMRDLLTSVDPNMRGADVRVSEMLAGASATASQRFAGHPRLEAELRQLIGTVFMNLNLLPESLVEFRKSHELWKSSVGEDDPQTLHSQMLIVHALSNQSRHRECLQLLADLEPRVARVLGQGDLLALEGQRLRGLSQTMMSNPDIGERTLREALAQAIALQVPERAQLSLMESLGQNLLFQLRTVERDQVERIRTELEALSRRVAEGAERISGPQSLQALRARFALARTVWQRGDFASAAEICRSILDASDGRLGECHHVRTNARNLLQWSLYRLGDAPAAADLALHNIQCQRSMGNPLIVLGAMYESLPFLEQGGRWVEGEAIARETSEILREYGGGHGAMLIGSDSHLARFISLQGRLDEAQVMFDSLLARLDGGEAADEPNLAARVHAHYAGHLIKRGDFAGAERHLKTVEALKGDIRRGTFDTVNDDLIVEFIAFYDATSQPEEAHRYRAMQAEVLGDPTALDPITSPE